jgi:beta-lactamase regulating signal transducer with metallopeptidase domain
MSGQELRRLAEMSLTPVVAHVWSSTIFLLLVLTVMMVFRRRLTAGGRFWLALTGILKFALPAALIAPWARLPFREATPLQLQLPLQLLGGNLPVTRVSMAPALWPAVAAAVWIVIAAALIIRQALIRHRLVAMAIRTAEPAHAREAESLARARERIGARPAIDIVRAALPESPAVLRIFRPLVVLPLSGCDDLTDDELESLLTHECAHVARHDNLLARVESVICAVFWFHPLIWIAQRITATERERACDEVVAETAEGRERYLAALTKFCRAAIAPRLPGVSCMATARLKERMDHVMEYPVLKAQAPSSKRVALLGAAALILFTVAAGVVGNSALASSNNDGAYAVRVEATRSGDAIWVAAVVTDNKTQRVVSAPNVTLSSGGPANMKTSGDGVEINFDVHPDQSNQLSVEVTIAKDGVVVQRNKLPVTVTEAKEQGESGRYTGQPITLHLKDAELRDVIKTFGNLTDLEMKMDDSVQGKVSVSWQNVPWDQAFDLLMKQNGLTWRMEGKTVIISKQ